MTGCSVPGSGCSRPSASSPPSSSQPREKPKTWKRRHLDHYAALARDTVDETLLGNDDLDRLEEERENLRVAFDLALEIEPELALELDAE